MKSEETLSLSHVLFSAIGTRPLLYSLTQSSLVTSPVSYGGKSYPMTPYVASRANILPPNHLKMKIENSNFKFNCYILVNSC